MQKIRLGILKEEKTPIDRRVPFSPQECSELVKMYPGLEIIVQRSDIRCYTDAEYEAVGIPLADDMSDCDILMCIKEVPHDRLIPNKKYIFFSHTIKKQPHNQKLLQTVLAKKITLVDYECLTDIYHNRIIGFGRYAGIIGAYNGILGYGKLYDLFNMKPANQCRDRDELEHELTHVHLPNMKILLTGGGRVANGVIETLGMLRMRKVTAYEFLHCSYREPVYCQLHSKDYYHAKDDSSWDVKDFYSHPENYVSSFLPYTKECDLLITAHFWDGKTPQLFTKEEMQQEHFKISEIADITCDLNGSVPSTLKASSIDDPFYGYNPQTGELDKPFSKDAITIMAVDNLPCELPRGSSEDFGKEFIERIMPSLLGEDRTGIIERGTIARDGKLTEPFEYLGDYAKEK